MPKTYSVFFIGAALFAFLVNLVGAAVVETKGGARLTGKLVAIDGTTVTLATDYAGELKIKQSEVTGMHTDEPQAVRLVDGTVMVGRVTTVNEGRLAITGENGVMVTPVDKIAATWVPGEKDPAITALEPRWAYEASADITGKTGNREQFGTAVSARAKRTGPHDMLQLYMAYNYQSSDGTASADQAKVGVDLTNNFFGRTSWYVRDEAGFDRVKDIDLYNVAATGFGYDFIKKPMQVLTGRAGVGHRYENYGNPLTDELNSFGLDFGLQHEYLFGDAKLVNKLTYTPAFAEFGNYRAMHESYLEIPLFNPSWKLRLGVTNDYTSHPGVGVDKLDTTYFTRFVLSWQ
jgi:putative salt-induced outer membrane protein YdiY